MMRSWTKCIGASLRKVCDQDAWRLQRAPYIESVQRAMAFLKSVCVCGEQGRLTSMLLAFSIERRCSTEISILLERTCI